MRVDQQAEVMCDKCKTKRIFEIGQHKNALALRCLTCKTMKLLEERKFCCDEMGTEIVNQEIIEYDPISQEHAIKYPDATNINSIKYCPWCGKTLPEVLDITYLPEERPEGEEATEPIEWGFAIITVIIAIVLLLSYFALIG